MSETNKNDTANLQSDEIDLIDLIGALWEGKWIIVGVTAIVSLLGAFYVFSQPRFVTATVPIVIEVNKNTWDKINKGLAKHELPLIENLPLANLIREQLPKLTVPETLSLVQVSTKENSDVVELILRGIDIDTTDLRWLSDRLQSIVVRVSDDNIRHIEGLIEQISDVSLFTQETIKLEIEDSLSAKRLEVASKIAYLEEQLAIARAIGQEYSVFQAREGVPVSSTSAVGLPYYHFGSIAISYELDSLKSKSTAIQSYPELVKLAAKQNLLTDTTDRLVAEIKAELSVLGDEVSAIVLTDEIVKSRDPLSMRIFILSVLVGGFLSLIILVFWNSLRAYWRRRANS